jgi:tRNA(adenine34) deaminase
MKQMYELKLYFCFMENPFTDEYFMKKALQEAEIAFEKGEIPVGAIIVVDNKIIARTHNLTELLHDVTAHAEMQAITSAANFIGGKYLKGCSLYVTLEPCQMCAGALYWSQISRIIFAARDEKRGFMTLGTQLHPKTEVKHGIYADEASALMVKFFASRRK